MSTAERTALYRLYDADDHLLYVGITTNIDARWGQHSTTKWWWKLVTRREVAWLDATWREALHVEAATIRAERPSYNGSHNHSLAPFDPETWPRIKAPRGKAIALADLVRAEIAAGRWKSGDRIPSTLDLAEASGVSKSTVDRALEALVNDGSIQRLTALGTFVSAGVRIARPNRQLAPRAAS